MSTTVFKDANYRIIGRIETLSDGSQVAKDGSFRIVGFYEPKTDVTKDAGHKIVAHGNVLASLLR